MKNRHTLSDMMVIHDHENPDMSYETDRLRFLGRMNTPDAPEALTSPTPTLRQPGFRAGSGFGHTLPACPATGRIRLLSTMLQA